MRIALAANGRLGLGLLRALQASPHHVVALVRDGRRLKGPLRWADTAVAGLGGPWTVEGRALSLGVPFVWLDRQDADEADRLATTRPDLLLVGNFGIILRRPILDVPAVGAVNTHWSLLPAHRGPHPSTSVLLAGETETGVTFHVVDERIDAGDILDQVAFPVGPDDTATSLYHRACLEAERRVVALVDRVASEGLAGTPQDLSAGSYWKRVGRAGARLDFARSAAELDRRVRALVRPMAWFPSRQGEVVVAVARPVEGTGPPGTILAVRPRVVVACREGALSLDRAWLRRPPLPWPGPWARVRVGDRVGPPTREVSEGGQPAVE
jgi:methionyl-tRNA formyltransferase